MRKFTKTILHVRLPTVQAEQIIDHINRCEGKTFSDRFRAFLIQAVADRQGAQNEPE